MKKQVILCLAVLCLLVCAFVTGKLLYERDQVVTVDGIRLQRYTEYDLVNDVVEEIPLRLELTVRKTLFDSSLRISGRIIFDGDVDLTDALPGADPAVYAEIRELLRNGTEFSTVVDNGFLYGSYNVSELELRSGPYAIASDPGLRLQASVLALAPDYSKVYYLNDSPFDATYCDRVTLAFPSFQQSQTSTYVYLCDLTPLRNALAGVCD